VRRVVPQHDLRAEAIHDLASWRWRVLLLIVVFPVVPQEELTVSVSSSSFRLPFRLPFFLLLDLILVVVVFKIEPGLLIGILKLAVADGSSSPASTRQRSRASSARAYR